MQSNFSDLETMSIGNCLDYVDEWIEAHNPNKEKNKESNAS